MAKAMIFLNGNPYQGAIYKGSGDICVCADGAYNWTKSKCVVDVIVGDMDSIAKIPDNVELVRVPEKKDFSDGYLAVSYCISKGYSVIELYGADGGRLDHQYANLHLLKALNDKGASGVIVTDDCRVYLINQPTIIPLIKNCNVSVVPLGGFVHISNTRGLMYPFPNERLGGHDGIGLSNIATEDEGYIELSEGEAFVFVYMP